MHSLKTLGLACIAAMSTSVFAADRAGPSPHQEADAAYLLVESDTAGTWRDRALILRQDRLNYLNGALCLERRGCSTALAGVASARVAERDYIDALDLGSYGPMNVKFTGDRVKLKVRF